MRTLIAMALLASATAGALADGMPTPEYVPVEPTYKRPGSGYTYKEEYHQYGDAPIVIDRRPVVVEERTGPVYVVPPPGYYGPPISLRRYYKLLERGEDPFYGYGY